MEENEGQIPFYPIIGIAPTKKSTEKEEGSGIVKGEDASEETKKRIWTLAKERGIEDTTANRKLAYRIDALVRFIINIKRFSILKDYHLSSSDNDANEVLMKEIETFIREIKLMSSFRQVFTPLQIEGSGHLQMLLEGTALTGLAVLENLVKHTDPTNINDYFYYQSQNVSKNWQDPEETETKLLRVWFIDESKRDEYTKIKADEDTVLSRDLIIEVLNNESGESNMQTVVSFVFIKNFLLQLLPNLIEIVTSPSEEIIYSTVNKAGVSLIPKFPPESLKAIDAPKYAAQVKKYNTWKTNLSALANKISRDRTKQRKSIHPDTIVEKVLESSQSLNSQMIDAIINVLDTQIAYGMNFSISLINPRGSELATNQNIYSVVATTMRGIQQQFQDVAEKLIYDKFPNALTAGIEFELEELNPEDALVVAERKKLYAETTEIMTNIGFDPATIDAFANKNIDEALELTEGISTEVGEAAEKVVEGMLDYRNEHLDEEGT
jgi:hypothetical protein